MPRNVYAYIEKSFRARFISDFPRRGQTGSAISTPGGGGQAAQQGIGIDTDPGLMVWINGISIKSIELLYDPNQFYVSPADLTINPMFNVPISREGDVGVTSLFSFPDNRELKEYFLTIFPYEAGSRPGRVTTLTVDIIGKPDWLKMRIKGGFRETAIFRKTDSSKDGSGEFVFESITRGPVL